VTSKIAPCGLRVKIIVHPGFKGNQVVRCRAVLDNKAIEEFKSAENLTSPDNEK
jgi:hypothetical protein